MTSSSSSNSSKCFVILCPPLLLPYPGTQGLTFGSRESARAHATSLFREGDLPAYVCELRDPTVVSGFCHGVAMGLLPGLGPPRRRRRRRPYLFWGGGEADIPKQIPKQMQAPRVQSLWRLGVDYKGRVEVSGDPCTDEEAERVLREVEEELRTDMAADRWLQEIEGQRVVDDRVATLLTFGDRQARDAAWDAAREAEKRSAVRRL